MLGKFCSGRLAIEENEACRLMIDCSVRLSRRCITLVKRSVGPSDLLEAGETGQIGAGVVDGVEIRDEEALCHHLVYDAMAERGERGMRLGQACGRREGGRKSQV